METLFWKRKTNYKDAYNYYLYINDIVIVMYSLDHSLMPLFLPINSSYGKTVFHVGSDTYASCTRTS